MSYGVLWCLMVGFGPPGVDFGPPGVDFGPPGVDFGPPSTFLLRPCNTL